ncbi:MAG TPA: YraN family protein [Devosia sp.]|nr:YraN family protein [Devosia sp.]
MPLSPSKPRSDARLIAEKQGRRAEALAALWLQLQLYRVLERRFKTPVGEIDLIAERFGTTVFIEVKARTRNAGEFEALGKVNQRRLVRAANYYLSRHPEKAASPLRFDVIFLAPRQWPRHLKAAFTS